MAGSHDTFQVVQDDFLGGGFKYVLFSSLFGEDSHFDSYFSDGLKPPTSTPWNFGHLEGIQKLSGCFRLVQPKGSVTFCYKKGRANWGTMSGKPSSVVNQDFRCFLGPWISVVAFVFFLFVAPHIAEGAVVILRNLGVTNRGSCGHCFVLTPDP